jgi:hypothetical protein
MIILGGLGEVHAAHVSGGAGRSQIRTKVVSRRTIPDHTFKKPLAHLREAFTTAGRLLDIGWRDRVVPAARGGKHHVANDEAAAALTAAVTRFAP